MTAVPAEPPAPPPTTFKDAEGREWRVRITAGLLGRVRAEAGIPLAAIVRDNAALAELLYTDPETLGRVIWLAVADQAEARGVTPEQFYDAFDADTLQGSVSALIGAVMDFTPRSPVARQSRLGTEAILKLMDSAAVEAMGRELARVQSTSKPSAGNSPGPPASIPGPSPSAN